VKLALIGNCAYQALVDDQARIVWLCWPRFDSSFVFGSLLDGAKGGAFEIVPAEGSFETHQTYVDNTNILRTVFETGSGSFEVIDFAPRFKQYARYFKPTMLMRRIRPLSGVPRLHLVCRPVYDYARIVPTSYLASNHIEWNLPNASLRLTTNVPLTYIDESRDFVLEREAYFCLTWGSPLEAPLVETWRSFYERTVAYWERWVKHTQVPGRFQREIIRSALALKLHQFEDTGAITAAATTSLPEEHGAGRNWDYRFCWLRDSYFTLKAMHRIGHFEEMEGFVQFLKNIAEASPISLQPVYAINGEPELSEEVLSHLVGYKGNQPVRNGNAAHFQIQNDVYGEMLSAIAPLFTDIRFGKPAAAEERLVAQLLGRIEHTLVQPDAGIWEYRGTARVHTFSLLMHWFGARVAERIAKTMGDEEQRLRARGVAARAREVIETECYRPELGYYGDSTTTSNADAALFMMVNLGYLHVNDARAERHVRALAEQLRTHGHLMHRYRHDDDFGASRSTFTVCGFWYAEALARLGYRQEAEDMCRGILDLANHVGLFSEDLDPETGEQLGNFPQTYSHVGLINAAFAISPAPEELED
jgi:GH15 family glucan-1,4-alpha-glucosidase